MAGSPMAGKAQTVLGPVPAEELGVTLPHEHLLIDFRLRRVIMCHIDRTVSDRARLKAIADTGCYLEYDLFGLEVSHYPMSDFEIPSDAERMRQILWLMEQGHGRQILLAHDICFKVRLVRYGGHGWAHILRRIVPRLRRKGVGEKEIWALIAENPTRAVTFA